MKLDLNKDLIKILFDKRKTYIEVEQEQSSEKFSIDIQKVLNEYLLSIDSMKKYMEMYRSNDLEGSGFSIELKKFVEIVYDFGVYNDEFEERLLRLHLKMDFNLNIVHSTISLDFKETEFIYRY